MPLGYEPRGSAGVAVQSRFNPVPCLLVCAMPVTGQPTVALASQWQVLGKVGNCSGLGHWSSTTQGGLDSGCEPVQVL
jgi:hypothetical protein